MQYEHVRLICAKAEQSDRPKWTQIDPRNQPRQREREKERERERERERESNRKKSLTVMQCESLFIARCMVEIDVCAVPKTGLECLR